MKLIPGSVVMQFASIGFDVAVFELSMALCTGSRLVIVPDESRVAGPELTDFMAAHSVTHAIIPPLLYLAMGTAEGHFITPSIMGHRLTLNPLTVFLSLVFWTWLWGPVGAFVSVPLLIIGMVAVEHLFPRAEPELPE